MLPKKGVIGVEMCMDIVALFAVKKCGCCPCIFAIRSNLSGNKNK